jgi:hypothetical protein
VTREDYEQQFEAVFAQIVAFARGEPTGVVNPDARL